MNSDNKPNIVVLGAHGMLGRIVYQYLKRKLPLTTWGTDRLDKTLLFFDASNPLPNLNRLKTSLRKIDYVINCIGVLKNNIESNDNSIQNAIIINSVFPHILALWAERINCKVIHVSTDAVFSASSGSVCEQNAPCPNEPYGTSKYLGEPFSQNVITFRTSILGFDPVNKKGLFEWIMKSKDKKITGYSNQLWSGCTVLQFAMLCHYIIMKNKFDIVRKKSSVYHFSPITSITKYEIIKIFIKLMSLEHTVIKSNGQKSTRSLHSLHNDLLQLNRYGQDFKKALIELKAFEDYS